MNAEGYEILEDYTADIAFIARGKTLEELFINAAKAITAIQVNPSHIDPKVCVDVKVDGFDLLELLKHWLDELLYLRDVKALFFSAYNLRIEKLMSDAESGGVSWVLEGKICGEEFDPEKHEPHVEIKAISYYDMEIKKEKEFYVARVLVDI